MYSYWAGGNAVIESVNQERQQKKQKHHKGDDEDPGCQLCIEGNNQTGTNQRFWIETDRIFNASKCTQS